MLLILAQATFISVFTVERHVRDRIDNGEATRRVEDIHCGPLRIDRDRARDPVARGAPNEILDHPPGCRVHDRDSGGEHGTRPLGTILGVAAVAILTNGLSRILAITNIARELSGLLTGALLVLALAGGLLPRYWARWRRRSSS